MLSDADAGEDHYNPSIRLLDLAKNDATNCGFQLTRGKWDPYPWVSNVEGETAAFQAGVKPGDCLLEVNGEDIVGRRITEIAEIVKSNPRQVSLLLWNAGIDTQCTPEALCCGPMPTNLQKLSACMSTIIAFLECPVCLDTIPPPTYQCDNGHLICIRCRTKSERCPVCRQKFTRSRSLLADQVYNALIDAFNLKEDADDIRSAKIHKIFKLKIKNNIPDIKITQSHTNKFLARIIGKACSVENLSSNSKLLSPSSHSSSSETNLKTKSLSNYEIFQSESPMVSRSGSMTRLSRNRSLIQTDDRPASYHGSFESLDRKMVDVREDGGDLFHCPFTLACKLTVEANNLIEHFQLNHNGPLTQYFNSSIQVNLNKIQSERDLTYMIHVGSNLFFLKVILQSTLDDILLWMWHAGSKKQSKEYEMRVEIRNSEADEVLLSVRSSVFSLSNVTWQEIKDDKKGIFLNAKTLQVLGLTFDDVQLSVTVYNNDD